MKTIDWTSVSLSLLAALLLGLAVGVASHWIPGAAISLVWMALHAATWGFAPEPPVSAPVEDPAQNIVWVAPEGGGGPHYAGM